MAVITYPVATVVDDSGDLVTGLVVGNVTVASVTTKNGTPISSPGATQYVSGPNVSVDYDAEAKGEAWITLTVTKSGVTGANASLSVYASQDSSRIVTALPNAALPAAVLGAAFEGAWTLADFCKLVAAVLVGDSTGGGLHFTSPVDGTTPRVTASVDGSFNRTVSAVDRS